ncbi:ATP-grasp domain-containing protein [Glycomyces sp. L485]|uniref:ATP-grasp domain-containing protein n=1 Tax=Glycomyces sp. L485 TaxID=2909235 RepID=UPI001F4A3C5F|nr:ATP-grasp domain-containing protein [Glycomyces sp. L485]MCH7231775.1 ATP-grasp domain-containing protein [Glycomyces sp. L485]
MEVVFLSYIPEVENVGEAMLAQASANLESRESIDRLVEHLRRYVPSMQAVDAGDAHWPELVDGKTVFNYTYGFGLLNESVRPTLVLEGRGIPYAGATPFGLYMSANKPHASALMRSHGFSCPREELVVGPLSTDQAGRLTEAFSGASHLVVKPAYEESSIGLALVPNEEKELSAAVGGLHDALRQPILVQEYIDGVDVTVPVIGRSRSSCLPAVALRHDRLHSGGPFVFDAMGKASKAGVHYESVEDWPQALRKELYAMVETAFAALGLRDYARLDCRVTPDGRCHFLEMNANPQLGLDKASFAVSARAAELTVGRVIQMVLDDAAPPYGTSPLAIGR